MGVFLKGLPIDHLCFGVADGLLCNDFFLLLVVDCDRDAFSYLCPTLGHFIPGSFYHYALQQRLDATQRVDQCCFLDSTGESKVIRTAGLFLLCF